MLRHVAVVVARSHACSRPFFAQAGQRWPYVMFVLDGSVRLERFDLEICEGGQIGAPE